MSASTTTTHEPPTAPPLLVLVGCACAISLITFGVRSIFGLFTDPVTETHGWTRETFAFAIALQNLMWGLTQPFAGALVDRYGPIRVLVAGGICYAAGLALMAASTSPLTLTLSAGILIGLGMGGASFVTVLGALGKLVPASHRGWALGMGTAAGSLGQFLFAPLGQAFIAGYGWQTAALLLAGGVALVVGLAFGVHGTPQAATAEQGPELTMRQTLRLALHHPSYVYLLLGFSVCGFQLAFITVHLPPYLNDQGIDAATAGWAIGAIGLANVLGAYAAGSLSTRLSQRGLLSLIYFARTVAILLFVTVPITDTSVMLFATSMGLLWLSTVPLTSGLVALMFGTRFMATLFGLIFLSHQVGSFFGVWLGGRLFEATASYEVVWWLTVALGAAAGLVHLSIRECPVPQPAVLARTG